jgi:hypothetical protein
MGFSDWFDNNWVDLARLLVQSGILAAVVWYSRKILRTMRASQEQVGALLRLSVSDTAARERQEQRPSMEQADVALPDVAPPGFAAPPFPTNQPASSTVPSAFGLGSRESGSVPDRQQSLGGRVVVERITAVKQPEPVSSAPSFTPWVAAPLDADAERSERLVSRMSDSPRALHPWSQEPPRVRSGNPLTRLVRWLQAPAGSKAPVRG